MRAIKLVVMVVFCAGVTALAYSAGPPAGHTGAPGELTCVDCHHGAALNSGSGRVTIEGVPGIYTAGQSYTITVRVTHPDRRRWGFQISAYTDALDTAGTFAITDTTHTKLLAEDGRTYVEHTTAGTYAGTTGGASWSFRWTAPPEGTGKVTFYAAGNAANNNGNDTGDNIYTTFAESSSSVDTPPFTNVTTTSGVDAASGGNAIAWADFDLDGDQDFFVARAGRGLLYRNDAGRFAEVSSALGIPSADATGAAWGDEDNDGRPDLLLATAAGARLLRNTGSGFTDATTGSGLSAAGPVTVAAWADADGDGWLDLLLAAGGNLALLRNGGAGTFADATATAGLAGISGVRSIAWGDYDGDGRGDAFVATSGAPRVLRQTSPGVFVDATSSSGLSGATAARTAVWTDYDGDLRLDLFVLTDSALKLYRNAGNGAFSDVTSSAGLAGISGTALAVDDSDGDGSIDVFVTGTGTDRLLRFSFTTFADATSKTGLGEFDGLAAVWADFDGDGHVDLARLSASSLELWENPSLAATVTVRPVTDRDSDAGDSDTATDRDAIGAVVAFDDNNNFSTGLRQVRVISGGGSASQPPARAVFAGVNGALVGVRVTFADGEGRQTSTTVATGAALVLRDPRAATIDSVTFKEKNGTNKLVVNGERFATTEEKVEVDGKQLETTKYPSKFRQGNGTSTRLVGQDTNFDVLVPPGRAVRVTTYDDSTGVRSAPAVVTRN